MLCVAWIPFAVTTGISDEGDDDDTANTISSSINVDSIETEGNGTVSSIVRACDTDQSEWCATSEQN